MDVSVSKAGEIAAIHAQQALKGHQIGEGEMLLKATHISVDPYLRGRMMEGKSYIEPFELNKAMSSGMMMQSDCTSEKSSKRKVSM